MVEPGARDLVADGAAPDPLEPLAGGESTRGSIWPAIYPELLKLVREHTSTIVFVNNRRASERLAKRLNEPAADEPHQELPATEHSGNAPPAGGAGRGPRTDALRPPAGPLPGTGPAGSSPSEI